MLESELELHSWNRPKVVDRRLQIHVTFYFSLNNFFFMLLNPGRKGIRKPFDFFKQAFLSVSLERTKSNPSDIELPQCFKAPELWLWSENSYWDKTKIKDSGEFKDGYSLVLRRLKPGLDQKSIYYRHMIRNYTEDFIFIIPFPLEKPLSIFTFMNSYICGYIFHMYVQGIPKMYMHFELL